MEESKKKISIENDKDIIFTKAIKAGKRIYYLDVKKNRKNELYLAITESKKVYSENGDDTKVTFEKHKIFLYQEDFEKFSNGLDEALSYIRLNQSIPEHQPRFADKDAEGTTQTTDGEQAEDAQDSAETAVQPLDTPAATPGEEEGESGKTNDDTLNITF